MLKFNRTHKRLVIPAGINPNYGIDSSALYNTSDADGKPEDILAGIVVYSNNGKIVGTLDVEAEIEESFNEGVQEQKSKLESISITENGSYSREDGWDEVIVDVPDLNGDYNEGLEDGIEIGKAEIIDGMNDATITANAVLEGYIGYGRNNERIVGTNVGGFDFGEIGYSVDDSNDANGIIKVNIAYSKTLYDAWDPNRTSASGLYSGNVSMVYAPNIDLSNVTTLNNMFNYCDELSFVPLLNTSNVTNMGNMFYHCASLTSVPQFDTTNVTNMDGMFYYCASLTSVPQFDTTKVISMRNMFYECTSLTSIPEFDTTNVTNMYGMFQGCRSLTSVPQFDTTKVISMRNMFYECTSLTSIPEMYAGKVSEIAFFCEYYSTIMKLVDFGGLVDLGKGFSNEKNANERELNLSTCANLSYQSCMNIINKVYDMNLTDIIDAKIKLHATAKALLSDDDIAIATSKGWTIS